MRKGSFLLLFIFLKTLLSAQDMKPLPDCNDAREKFKMIQQSFNDMAGAFKGSETGKKHGQTYFSTNISFCGEDGVLFTDKTELFDDVTLQFTFDNEKYTDDIQGFLDWADKIMKPLKKVFPTWELKSSKDEDEDGTYMEMVLTDKEIHPKVIKKIKFVMTIVDYSVTAKIIFNYTSY